LCGPIFTKLKCSQEIWKPQRGSLALKKINGDLSWYALAFFNVYCEVFVAVV